MNLREIENIIKIAEEGNVSHAAKKLYITPSALNQQLLHLEDELGIQLFHRIRTGWIPTEAGRIYLKGAKEIMKIKKETYQRLNDILDVHKGVLTIGFPPERGSFMFTAVYPIFHKKFPDVTVYVKETNVHNQQTLITKGEIDIGFVTLRENQQTGDIYLPLYQEEFILAVPSDHPLCGLAEDDSMGRYPVLPLSVLKDEVFALMYKESTAYEYVKQLFQEADFSPSVLFETSRADTILEMVASGFCCSIVPDAESMEHIDGVSFFCLDTHPCWNIMATYKKGGYLSKPGKYFIDLAAQYWNHSLD